MPAGGQRFDGWELSSGLSCTGGTDNPCTLDGHGVAAEAATATFVAVFDLAVFDLTVGSGTGGSVDVDLNAGDAGTVDAGPSVAVAAGDVVTLTAMPLAGHRFAGWELSSGLSCTGDTDNPCTLDGHGVAAAAATATFVAVSDLLVGAGAGGQVTAVFWVDRATAEIGAGPGQGFAFSTGEATTLTAIAAAGHRFVGWTFSGEEGGPQACSSQPSANTCVLDAGSVGAATTIIATFEPIPVTLTVGAGANGSVAADVNAAGEEMVDASQTFDFSVEGTARLEAVAANGYRFDKWSGPCAHFERPLCALYAGSVSANANATATFVVVATTLTVGADAGGLVQATINNTPMGRVDASSSRDFAFSVEGTARLEAVAANGYRFDKWSGVCALSKATCNLSAGSVTADVAATAAFVAAFGLAVGGSVGVMLNGRDAGTVGAGASSAVAVAVGDAVTLTAMAATGQRFDVWELSGGLSCAPSANVSPCTLLGHGARAATATATFVAVFDLTVGAGTGGSVDVDLNAGDAGTVDAGPSVAVAAGDVVTLTAMPAGGQRFDGWELSSGLSCTGGTDNPCTLLGHGAGVAAAAATFVAVFDLTVDVRAGGSVDVALNDGSDETVAAGASKAFAFAAGDVVELTTTGAAGYSFTRWMFSGGSLDGLENCPPQPFPVPNTCVLDASLFGTGGATATAIFSVVATMLEVSGDYGGVVLASVNGGGEQRVGGGQQNSFPFNVEGTARLKAMQDAGQRFIGWTFSGGLRACSSQPSANICDLAAGSVTADGSVSVTFTQEPTNALMWEGSGFVSANADDTTLTLSVSPLLPRAASSIGGASRATDRQSWTARSPWRTAAPPRRLPGSIHSRPQIKSLDFGLQYFEAPRHFRIEADIENAPGVFELVPGFDTLFPSPDSARLPVSTHLRRWEQGSYLTLACDASNECEEATGGRRALKRSDSIAATGYFKAPNADAEDAFGGRSIALSADGDTLAVGAIQEDSESTGTFAVGEDGYQAALDSNGASLFGGGGSVDSGAVYVYRRSARAGWAIQAFIKAPVTFRNDEFGHAIALSADGDTLAVGAFRENSASTGTFAPGEEGYQAALENNSNDTQDSGATYVYRRLEDSAWEIEAFIKAPVAERDDQFGVAIALSADGDTLAVGATQAHTCEFCASSGEGSSYTGTFAPGEDGYQAALKSNGANDSGAVYVYRRSARAGWAIQAFIKAPNVNAHDDFGATLALSADGDTLAVGAPSQDSMGSGAYAPNDPNYQTALVSREAAHSGAAYIYRRKAGRWSIEAFIKALVSGGGDVFGVALALSADGDTLAVGAFYEDSTYTGTFSLSQEPLPMAALLSNAVRDTGAVYVYRRSNARWSAEAFVKAPKADRDNEFGYSIALSADGTMLAVAWKDDSKVAGVFSPDSPSYQNALENEAKDKNGTVNIYHRSDDNRWTVGNLVMSPVDDDTKGSFGQAIALSADGATMAVGEPKINGLGGCAAGVPAPGGAGLAGADSRSAFPNVGSREKIAGMARESRPWPLSGTVQAGIPARIPPLPGRQAAARRPVRTTFSARNAKSRSPRALASPRTLKRRKPIASLIQPFGASESHLRRA